MLIAPSLTEIEGDDRDDKIIKLHMPGVILEPHSNVKTPMVRKPMHMLKSSGASFKKSLSNSLERRQGLKETNSYATLAKGKSGFVSAVNQNENSDKTHVKEQERRKQQFSLKELNPQDKKRVANLVKELAKLGEERVNAEERLQAEREAFEERLVILQEEYDAVLKEKQYLKKRFLELQALLAKYQGNGKTLSPPKTVQHQTIEDKESKQLSGTLTSYKATLISPLKSTTSESLGNTRPSNVGSTTVATGKKLTTLADSRADVILEQRNGSLEPLNNTRQLENRREQATQVNNSCLSSSETGEDFLDKMMSSQERPVFPEITCSSKGSNAVTSACQTQEIPETSRLREEVIPSTRNTQEERVNSTVASQGHPPSNSVSQPAVHHGPATISQYPLQTKSVFSVFGNGVHEAKTDGQLHVRKNEDRSFSEISGISGTFSAELDAVYRLYCREYELQLQLQQQQIELQKQQLQLQQQLQQVESLQQQQKHQLQQSQQLEPRQEQQQQQWVQQSHRQQPVGRTSPVQGEVRNSVKHDLPTVAENAFEETPSPCQVPRPSSKPHQVSPTRSLVPTPEDSSSIPINNKPLPKPVNPVQSPRTGSGPGAAVVQEHQGTVSEGSAPPASGHERMVRQKVNGIPMGPMTLNRAMSAPPGVGYTRSSLQHQLHRRHQGALRQPVDHDSSNSGYDYLPAADAQQTSDKGSFEPSSGRASTSRFSLYSHSDLSSRISRDQELYFDPIVSSGREASRLFHPNSKFDGNFKRNVSTADLLQPDILSYKGVTVRDQSSFSHFPMTESMELKPVARYQRKVDQSAGEMVSEDGPMSFRDHGMERGRDRVPLDSAYPLSLLDIVDGLENISSKLEESCRNSELGEGLDTTDSGYSNDTCKERTWPTDDEEAAVLEDIFFRPTGR